jgi:hypothetical protein
VTGVFLGIGVVAAAYVALVFGIVWLMEEFLGARGYVGLMAIGYAAIAQIVVTAPLAVWAWRRDWKGLSLSLAICGGLLCLVSTVCTGGALLA